MAVYEMSLVPSKFYKSDATDVTPETCVICYQILEPIDNFKEEDVAGVPDGFVAEGTLMVCPSCNHAHYVVDDMSVTKGPVTVQWGN